MIDPGFFRSRPFVISAVIALFLVGGAAGAYMAGGVDRSFVFSTPCDAPSGSATTLTPTTSRERDRRTETFTLHANATVDRLDLCVGVGEILVEPATGDVVTLEWLVRSDDPEVRESATVHVQLRERDGRQVLQAWEGTRTSRNGWFNSGGASTRLIVRLPDTHAYDLAAEVHVGDVRVSDLRLRNFEARADVGSVVATQLGLQGNGTVSSHVGDVILHLTSVQTGTLRATADTGNAEMSLPQRADVGYDATANAEVGSVTLDIGTSEMNENNKDPVGGRSHARTQGYALRPTKVVVWATTHVGDARIVAR